MGDRYEHEFDSLVIGDDNPNFQVCRHCELSGYTSDTECPARLRLALDAERAKVERPQEALGCLLDRLDEMVESVDAGLAIAQIHGFPFRGPTWADPYREARQALDETEDMP